MLFRARKDSLLLGFSLKIELLRVNAPDPQQRIADLERRLYWAELKVQLLEARLREQRIRLLVLLCYKRTIRCRIVLWERAPRQAHKENALRPTWMAWRRPQGMPIGIFR